MLQSIRDKAQGWFAWVIVSLLILVFAVWGIGSYFSPDPDPVIIDVDGEEIHLREFLRELTSTRQNLRESLGSRYNEDLFPAAVLRNQVVERFINQALLRHMSEQIGVRVGDAQLATAIRQYQAFQVDGRFSAEKYRQMLQYQGMSEAGFEHQMRLNETTKQVRDGIGGTAFATTLEVDQALALVGQTRELAHLTLSPGEFADGLELTDEQIEQYYQDHLARFSEPERVQVDYLELNLDELADKVQVSDAAINKRYKDAKASFMTPESRRARHILIEVAKDADDAALAAAEQKVAEVNARLAAGEDFAAVAKEVSDDSGSAAKGGDLGFFTRNMMVPAFEKVAFSLPVGQLSDPVRSPFGFHLIEVTEIRAEQVKPLADVREQLVREEQLQQAEQQFYDLGETFANVAYEQPDSLEPAAEAVGLDIRHAGPFSRDDGTGIAAQRAFIDAAFRSDLIADGTNSEPLELGPTQIVILRVTEHQAATPKPLADVRTEVENGLRKQEAAKEARRLGEALLEQLRAGGDPEKTLAEHGRQWLHDGFVALSDSQKLPPDALSATFALAPPADGRGSFGGTTSGDEYVLLWVSAVKDGSADDAEPARRQAVAAALERRWGEAEFSALLTELRSKAEIKVFLQNIP